MKKITGLDLELRHQRKVTASKLPYPMLNDCEYGEFDDAWDRNGCHNFNFEEIFNNIIDDEENFYDAYDVDGEMINQFMQAFPPLKAAWDKMDNGEKWAFIQAIHYGINPLTRDWLGYTQG